MASILNATTTSGLVTSADNSGSLQLQTNNGTTAVTIDTSQNVGIGTSSPSYVLHVSKAQGSAAVQSTTTTNSTYLAFINGGGTSYVGVDNSTGGVFSSGAYGMTLFNAANSATTFFTNATERMRITSGGDLLVGTTSTYNSSYRMSLAPASGTGGIVFKNASTSPHYPYTFLNSSGTTVGYIEAANTATTYVTTSDYRLKENIEPMRGALNKVAQLKPVIYTWKTDGSASQGFIAHELQAVVPECVTGEKDAVNEDGSIKPQGVDTSFLVATLTAAIQELKAELDTVKAELNTLKNPPVEGTE